VVTGEEGRGIAVVGVLNLRTTDGNVRNQLWNKPDELRLCSGDLESSSMIPTVKRERMLCA
jgi:hypothetical protein